MNLIVQKKIEELNKLKESLVKLESLNKPDNEAVFFTNQSISEAAPSSGVTPYNLGEAFSKILTSISDYKKQLIGLPFTLKERSVNASGIRYISSFGQIAPRGYAVSSMNAYVGQIQETAKVSMFQGGDEMIIKANPTIKKKDGTPVLFETMVIKIGGNNYTEFSSGVGHSLNIKLSAPSFHPCNIFVIGIKLHEKMQSDTFYNMDLSYTVGIGDDILNATIANTRIGEQTVNIEATASPQIALYDILGCKTLSVPTVDYSGAKTRFDIGASGLYTQTNYPGNFIVSLDGVDVSKFKIAHRENVTRTRSLIDRTINVFEKLESSSSELIIPGVRPISYVLEEALLEL